MLRQTFAEIHLSHLEHNIKLLKRRHGEHPFFCPMIKANGYGHGDVEVAKKLDAIGIERFGVVLVEEGLRLRKNGIKNKILVFGTYSKDSMEELLENNLEPVISDMFQLELLKETRKTAGIAFHIKFNTGMNRLGFSEHEIPLILNTLDTNKNLILESICSHFHSAEDAGEPSGHTEEQIKKFLKIAEKFSQKNVLYHCLNSAALLLNLQDKYAIGARPGITIYGIKPALNKDLEIDLKPVMHLKSYIGQIHEVKKGRTVSYGGTWKASEDSLIATVPVGYADGYSRYFSNNGFMIFREKKVPVTGIVCMDYTMIDITAFKNDKKIEIGEEVCVFGTQGQTSFHSWEQAKLTKSHPYELVTRISERVPRVYIK